MKNKILSLLMVLSLILSILVCNVNASIYQKDTSSLFDAQQFTNEQIKTIADYHVQNYLGGLLFETPIKTSDDKLPLYDMDNNIIAYAVPLVDKDNIVQGHINVGAIVDGYNFYAIEEQGDTYQKLAELNSDGKQIVFLPPASYLIKNNSDKKEKTLDKYFKLTGEELNLEKMKDELVTIKKIYSSIRKDKNKANNETILNKDNSVVAYVTAESVSLSDETYFVKIMDGTTRYYGGNQSWFSLESQQNTGCGPTAAANITAYMALKKSWASDLYAYNKTSITKSDFTNHMNEVIAYVAPNPIWGMPSYTAWGDDVEDFAQSRDVPLYAYYSSLSPTLDNASNYVKAGLNNDSPVGMLMYYNPYLSEYDWHWMTITKYTRDIYDNRYVAVSSWGNRYSLNFEFFWENSLYGALLYFY